MADQTAFPKVKQCSVIKFYVLKGAKQLKFVGGSRMRIVPHISDKKMFTDGLHCLKKNWRNVEDKDEPERLTEIRFSELIKSIHGLSQQNGDCE